MKRVDVVCNKTPGFFGVWFMDNAGLCEQIIEFFECNPAMHEAGVSYSGIDPSKKNSTDLIVNPNDLTKPTHAVFRSYFLELHRCYLDYLEQWPFLKGSLKEVDIGSFNIQRYNAGGHFAAVHTERDSIATMHRVLVWMTYLNDVEGEGHTSFLHYGLDVKPERGKTLIWPSDWTHAHRGNIVTSGSKYIITGWMHYPLVREGEGIAALDIAAGG
jgi:hypothetical protein